LHGEAVVMRLLRQNSTLRGLSQIGLNTRELECFQRVLQLPHGIILVTGPTGSGKTSTLYTALNEINDAVRKIITVEDPVEYQLKGVNQIQVNEKSGLTFARGLRSILRHDPDVILIGEIRDRETMEYGIQFAETGHLVLATLHANSANQALDRIVNFFPDEKREQLLMDLSLNIQALISQRLIPREGGHGRIAAMEIMLRSPLIADLIFKGDINGLKEVMSRSDRMGMKTFDQSLYELYESEMITYEDALRSADSKNELRLRIKLESKRFDPQGSEEAASLRIIDEQ